MKQFWKDLGIAAVMGMIIPAMILAGVVSICSERKRITIPTETTPVTSLPDETAGQAMIIQVLDSDGAAVEMELNTYLTRVVLAEMPASFEDEALKAQSVVARTFALRAASGASKHKQAAVCMNAACCQGYMTMETYLQKGGKEESITRVKKLVDATDGLVLTYEGALIEATYFSCSGGSTEDAAAVWGTDVPYLQSVTSPGEEHAAHYTDTVTFSAADLAKKLGIAPAGEPSTWFGAATYTEGGGVAAIKIGEKEYTGTEIRKLLGLRSTAFEIAVDGEMIDITTHGYGHRVGMSQYGADAMAALGSSFEEILTYYYQGTELAQYAD